jgi:valyl-tRNA synthetase
MERVLKDPFLLMEMLRLYSEVFLKLRPCSTCEDKHKGYYTKLLHEGEKQILKLDIMAENICKMKEGVNLFHKGNVFNHLNITDRIAAAMLKRQPILEKHFDAYPPDYKPTSDEAKLVDTKKKLAEANKEHKAALKDLRNAEKAAKVDVEDTNKLQEKYQEAVDLVEKADDDKKENLQKEVDKVQGKIDEIVKGREAPEDAVVKAEEKAEVAEAEVVKFNSLLKKREK